MEETTQAQAAPETRETTDAQIPPGTESVAEGQARAPVFAAAAQGPLARPESRRDQINGALRQLAAGKL